MKSELKQLQHLTGANLMKCQKALNESNNDMHAAVKILNNSGFDTAMKVKDRETKEGVIESYIHVGGKLGVLVEIHCETDFVAKNAEFRQFAKDVAMHIAASAPRWITRDEITEDQWIPIKHSIAIQYQNFSQNPLDSWKLWEEYYFKELNKRMPLLCLLEQSFIKETEITVSELQRRMISKFKENIRIVRFTYYSINS